MLKTGRSGEMIFVTIRHHYETARGMALVERQDVVYRGLETSAPPPSGSAPDADEEPADTSRPLEADPAFQFRSLFAGGRPRLNLRSDADGVALWITNDGGDVTMRARGR